MKSTAENRSLERRVARRLRAAGVEKGSLLLVGVSGGPDSTALLRILGVLSGPERFNLHACYVDHGIRSRSEIDADVAFVDGQSRSCGAVFHPRSVPQGECVSKAKHEKKSLEEAARELRLGLLSRLREELGARAIILGHTRDDQIETLLMRVMQGAGILGLAGIRQKRGFFVRPLLTTSRTEILAYLSSEGTGYRIDSTNSETVYLRNRIRAHVVPALQIAFPGFHKGMISMSRQLSVYGDFLRMEASERLSWQRFGSGFQIDKGIFFGSPPALRAFSLQSLYDTVRPRTAPRRLPFRFVEPVLSAELPGRDVLLRGHGMVLRRDGEVLFWGPYIATCGEKGYFIAVETGGTYAIPETSVCIELLRGVRRCASEGDIEIRSSAIAEPLVLRSGRKGDELPAACGSKSLKDILREWKVRREERDLIPLLADRKGILAVLGGASGYGTRVRAGARADSGSEDTLVVRIRRTKLTEGWREQQL
jgi:tRNA(Ile)-lysidine synthase